ncbi:hypothetical protein M8C21_005972, partial [Ambrosia artemisiifolia]
FSTALPLPLLLHIIISHRNHFLFSTLSDLSANFAPLRFMVLAITGSRHIRKNPSLSDLPNFQHRDRDESDRYQESTETLTRSLSEFGMMAADAEPAKIILRRRQFGNQPGTTTKEKMAIEIESETTLKIDGGGGGCSEAA